MRFTSNEEYQEYKRKHEHLEIYKELEFEVEARELKVQDALLLMQIREQRELNRILKQIDNTLKKSIEKKIGTFYSMADI